MGEVEAHEAVVCVHQGRVDVEVGRGAGESCRRRVVSDTSIENSGNDGDAVR